MCDYSLAGIPNRLAAEGEQLIVNRFRTGSIGLAPAADFTALQEWPVSPSGRVRRRSGLSSFFQGSSPKITTCAVCIPPGARLLLYDIPERLQHELQLAEAEEVTFTQLSAEEHEYRDAVRFSNGRELLLQRLTEGQRVHILRLPDSGTEEEAVQASPASVSHSVS